MLELRASDAIQGNVLTPFPDGGQAFLLFHFPGAEGAQALLAELLPTLTTTAELLHAPPRVARGIALTAAGLTKLAPACAADLDPFIAFVEGPVLRAPRMRDHGPSAPEQWVFGGLGQPAVDAVLTLAAEEPGAVEEEASHWRQRARSLGVEFLFDQRGARLPGAMAGCEHFGFKDGISQPAVAGFDESGRLIPAGEFILGRPRLAACGGECDPLPCPDWMRDGSFQVLRRLTQDVAGWRAQLTRLAEPLSLCPQRLAAKLMGRWPNGAPLALAPEHDRQASFDADFDFNDDGFGYKTPRFAHIRKMYPRDDAIFERDWHRIIRRGIPFGPVYEPEGEDAGAERGLVFVAFMASLESQFEFLMRGWANDPDFYEAGDGPDPLIGHSHLPATLRHPDACPAPLSFQRFVQTTGCVYAFAPSKPVVAQLARR